MNKKSLLFALILICMASVQCTEDETVEASVAHSQIYSLESGEEGADDKDTDKDKKWVITFYIITRLD